MQVEEAERERAKDDRRKEEGGMSGNVGASMEFTARVGSILRGLLPRCWITESGSQRLDGLFECLLQKTAVPAPTFYGATLSCVLEIVSRRLCIHIALEIGSWPRRPSSPPPPAWYRPNARDSCRVAPSRFVENFLSSASCRLLATVSSFCSRGNFSLCV